MKETIKEILITRGGDPALKLSADKPAVLMMVGVNGGPSFSFFFHFFLLLFFSGACCALNPTP
jgi:hypothetical protein